MGPEAAELTPIPTPALPLKGREKGSGAPKLALVPLRGEGWGEGCSANGNCRHSTPNPISAARRENATTRHPALLNIGSKHPPTRLLAPSTPTRNSTTPRPRFSEHAPRG
jgi:hypothetical protein